MTQPAQVARITPAGVVTMFPVTLGSSPTGIVSGSDGNLWLTERGGPPTGVGRVAKMTTAGVVTEYDLAVASHPDGTPPAPTGTYGWRKRVTWGRRGSQARSPASPQRA